jgi:hypothetical protein
MQNKPNLLNAQMNLSSVRATNYEQTTMDNEPKNKPNQTQFIARQGHPEPKQTQFAMAKPPCRGEVTYEAGPRRTHVRSRPAANPDQTKTVDNQGQVAILGLLNRQNVNPYRNHEGVRYG